MAQVKPDIETFARIKVIGIGGGGGNAISRMVDCQIRGVEFAAINADAQDLSNCKASERLLIGKNLTKGLGAGMNPDIGHQAAEENRDEIQEAVKDTDMVFVTCGLGGGVGTGASPIVAEAAREAGALTVGVVTKPFSFEGTQRNEIAEKGLGNLKDKVDTLIIIPNDKILQVIDEKVSLLEAFEVVDDILRQGVQGISDLITVPGVVNVDFADVKSVMQNAGTALMGIGKADGENRAVKAAKNAIDNSLLELSIDGARGVLFNITGGSDIGMGEIHEAAQVITESIDPDSRVIFGAVIDDEIDDDAVKVTVVATDFGENGGQSNVQNWSASASDKKGLLSGSGLAKETDISDSQKQSDNNSDEDSDTETEESKKAEDKEEKSVQNKDSDVIDIEPLEEDSQESEDSQENKEKDDILDIPAFIRKRMK